MRAMFVVRRTEACPRADAIRELYRKFFAENTSDARSVRLLLKWLSPDQREQFDDSRFFDVVGCDSGRRYRIYDGIASPNVYEIDDVGRRIVGLCFMPAGHLPWGDVILA